MEKKLIFYFLTAVLTASGLQAQTPDRYLRPDRICLDSKEGHQGAFAWQMKKTGEVVSTAASLSMPGYITEGWMPAIVPGTVLNSLVHNKIYPEPYYGLNNKLTQNLIPDLATAGREFYTYWFRTEFEVPESYRDKIVWLQVDGINYRAEVWINGHLLGNIAGMFQQEYIDITEFALIGGKNALAIKVYPVDVPGTVKQKQWGAPGEFHNGGDGNIGLNTTMLMSAGWDFTYLDGIRDRNTGIWKSISLYATGRAVLRHPFVKSELNAPDYNLSKETVSVEVSNPTTRSVECVISGEIAGEGITFNKSVKLFRGETREVVFTPEEYPQLAIRNPRLWWPLFKGTPELYELKLNVEIKGVRSDSLNTRFGIREIISDTNTPDQSRQFYVNGKKIFIRGTNWIPEAMLRSSNERTYAELRYTRQSGINLIRFWGGGITESDYFFQLCDEMGLLVWQEFWITGDTKHPHDKNLYLSNVESTVKRIRNHPSLAYYVSSNESTEMPETESLILRLDGTRGYQMQSECCGVHDGSPYKQVNPMQHYENTASERGSRIDGFNPEYGAPTIPVVETLREIMDEKDLWPINAEVWDYHDGGGFHLMSTLYKDLTNNYGTSSSIDEFALKGQFLGAMNSKAIWESWNYNKLDYGDRYCSGLLFWYHNSPLPQVCDRMWDHSLEPTASLYHTQNALEPLHAQFDYLKNTVSVYNDYYQSFAGYKVSAEVYNLRSRKVWEKAQKIDIPEDGVVNDVFGIDFPADISKVHFIKLRLFDDKGKEIANSFYWRSTDKYEGAKTLTGPAASGFEPLSELPEVQLQVKYKTRVENGRHFIDAELKNTSGVIAFFTQLQLLNAADKPIRPSFYTDNFFSLLPGESGKVTIETASSDLPAEKHFVVKGWNVKKQIFALK
jgi:exo-1,4-beta-D-glucosaminidase